MRTGSVGTVRRLRSRGNISAINNEFAACPLTRIVAGNERRLCNLTYIGQPIHRNFGHGCYCKFSTLRRGRL